VAGTRITDAGKKSLDKFESQRDVDRRIQAAILSFVAFCDTRGVLLSDEEAGQAVSKFIELNTDPLLSLMHEGKLPSRAEDREETSRLFVAFLLQCERADPKLFSTLQDLILGATIASVLNYHQEVFEGLQDKSFSSCTLFFDANYLFSLLGLDSDEFNLAAKELYQLILPRGFSLSTFDFTISEMSKVLRGYLRNHNRYPTTIRVNSIYSSLRGKGYRESDVIDLISNLEDRLSKLKIGVKRTGIDLGKYKTEDKDLLSSMMRYKSYQPTFYQNHDVAILEKIRKYRKRSIRKFEDANCFLVTSDYRLAKLNYLEMGHKDSQTIGEVILDRMLTTILFLKNPRGTVPIRSIVASYSRELFVQRHIWDAFYHALCEVKAKGGIDDRTLSLMFYNGFIEEELSDFGDHDTAKIDESFVILEAEKAASRYKNMVELQLSQQKEEARREAKLLLDSQEKEFRDLIAKQEGDFLSSLVSTRDQIERQKDVEFENRLRLIEENLRRTAKRDATRIIAWVRVLVGCALLIPIGLLVSGLAQGKEQREMLFSTASIIGYILAVVDGGLQIVQPIWELATTWLSGLIFRRRRDGLFEPGD
jgi:hypothetical protein